MERTKDGTDNTDGNFREKKSPICPVCGNLLHERNLPDMEGIIYDNLYHQGRVRIGSPKVRLYCDFEHCFDEEGFTMDDPHDLVGVIDAAFDQSGECIRFEVIEIRPAEKEVGQMEDKAHLLELFNFSCVLRGEVKYLEQIKEYIAKEYINKGLVKLIKPTYDKKEIYILTDEQWKEYQTLKERDEKLMAGLFG